MLKKKKIECKTGCVKMYLDMVVLSCEKCIKHIQYPLTEKQKEQITQILNSK